MIYQQAGKQHGSSEACHVSVKLTVHYSTLKLIFVLACEICHYVVCYYSEFLSTKWTIPTQFQLIGEMGISTDCNLCKFARQSFNQIMG